MKNKIIIPILLIISIYSCVNKKTDYEKSPFFDKKTDIKYNDSLKLFLGFYEGMYHKEVDSVTKYEIGKGNLSYAPYGLLTNQEKEMKIPTFMVKTENSELLFRVNFNFFYNTGATITSNKLRSIKLSPLRIEGSKYSSNQKRADVKELIKIYSKKYGKPTIIKDSSEFYNKKTNSSKLKKYNSYTFENIKNNTLIKIPEYYPTIEYYKLFSEKERIKKFREYKNSKKQREINKTNENI